MAEEEIQGKAVDKKSGGKDVQNSIIKYLIIVIIFVLLIGLIFAISYYVSFFVAKVGENQRLFIRDEAGIEYNTEATYEFDEFLVASKDLGIIKAKMQLELSALGMPEEMIFCLGEMRNLVNGILASKTAEEANELASRNLLQNEIWEKLDELLGKYFMLSGVFAAGSKPKKIVRVNFKDFYVKK